VSQEFLSTDEQVAKLSKLHDKATEAVKSNNLIEKLGGITIFAGITEFYVIQVARLIEQVILKSELAQNKNPSFQPKDDSYFYDERVSTRTIIKVIEKFFPFKLHGNSEGDESKINAVAKKYLESVGKFLNYRNALLHHIGSPKISENKIFELIQKSIDSFFTTMESQQEFFKTWQPFRFGSNELKYFYNPKNNDA